MGPGLARAKQKRWISKFTPVGPGGWRMDPCGYTVSGKFKSGSGFGR
jgi:hypothetical protein